MLNSNLERNSKIEAYIITVDIERKETPTPVDANRQHQKSSHYPQPESTLRVLDLLQVWLKDSKKIMIHHQLIAIIVASAIFFQHLLKLSHRVKQFVGSASHQARTDSNHSRVKCLSTISSFFSSPFFSSSPRSFISTST